MSGRRVTNYLFDGINVSSPSLLGTWNLLSWEIRSSDGTVTYPIGENPNGVITYDGAGRMAVQLMQTDRPLSDSADPYGAAPDEIIAAWMGFISYAGGYEHDPLNRRVVHQICSFPNWVGSSQERFYDFDNGLLVLGASKPLTLRPTRLGAWTWEPMDHE